MLLRDKIVWFEVERFVSSFSRKQFLPCWWKPQVTYCILCTHLFVLEQCEAPHRKALYSVSLIIRLQLRLIVTKVACSPALDKGEVSGGKRRL